MGLFGKMLEYSGKTAHHERKYSRKPFVCNKSSAQCERLRAANRGLSLFGNSLVQIKDDASHGSPGRQLRAVHFVVDFGLTHMQQPLRRIRIMTIAGYFALRQVPQNLALFGGWLARSRQPESKVDPRRRLAARFHNHT